MRRSMFLPIYSLSFRKTVFVSSSVKGLILISLLDTVSMGGLVLLFDCSSLSQIKEKQGCVHCLRSILDFRKHISVAFFRMVPSDICLYFDRWMEAVAA